MGTECWWAYIILASVVHIQIVDAYFLYEDDYFTTAQLVRVRGFEAIDHFVTTSDGYILNLVEIHNPEIPGGFSEFKEPILFIPGIINNSGFYIVSASGARAVDYSKINASLISEERLLKMFESNPAAKSLPLLASSFGHSVFLLNRRGSFQSQLNADINKQPYINPIENIIETVAGGFLPPAGRKKRQANYKADQFHEELWLKGESSDLKEHMTFNPRYWNFSLDEQALFDIPDIIKYILKETNKKKMALVGHSTGSALILMSLSALPDLANNVSKAILFGPALYPTSIRDLLAASLSQFPFLSYIGPILPAPILLTLEYFLETVCSNIILRNLICIPLTDGVYGLGGTQLDFVCNLDKFFKITADFESSHSAESLAQAAIKGKMHHFDYVIQQRNQIAYGRDSPPIYDVSKIKLKTISLWSGVTDGLVPYRTALEIGNDMSVPVEQVYLNEPGLLFNHISYSIHYDLPRLVNIPALKRIES